MNCLKNNNNKKRRFLLLFNRLCLDFLFFIDCYSMVHHLPMINLTKLTATRRHVYPKRTNFSKTLGIVSRAPARTLRLLPRHQQTMLTWAQEHADDLTAMEYNHYLSDESTFIHNHNDRGRRFTGNNLNASIFSVSVMSEQVTIMVLWSVCSGTVSHSFDRKIVTITYLGSEWRSLDIRKNSFLKKYVFLELLPFSWFSLRFTSNFEE